MNILLAHAAAAILSALLLGLAAMRVYVDSLDADADRGSGS